MRVLDSLLRKKRLSLSHQMQRLNEAARKREHATQVFSLSRRAHEEAQHYLWRQLSPDESLCVQRLAVAKSEERRCEQRMRDGQAAHRACVSEHEACEKAVMRTQREIEKLEEIRATRLAEAAQTRQAGEWQRLDEWITVRQGEQP